MAASIGAASAETGANAGKGSGGVFPHLLPASGLPLGNWDLEIGPTLGLIQGACLNK